MIAKTFLNFIYFYSLTFFQGFRILLDWPLLHRQPRGLWYDVLSRQDGDSRSLRPSRSTKTLSPTWLRESSGAQLQVIHYVGLYIVPHIWRCFKLCPYVSACSKATKYEYMYNTKSCLLSLVMT